MSTEVPPPTLSTADAMRGLPATFGAPWNEPYDWPTQKTLATLVGEGGAMNMPFATSALWNRFSAPGAAGESARMRADWSITSWRFTSRVRKKFALMKYSAEASVWPFAPPAAAHAAEHAGEAQSCGTCASDVVQVPGAGVSPCPASAALGVQVPGAVHSEFLAQKARSPCSGESIAATTMPLALS